MKRSWPFIALLACASNEPPPHTEVAPNPPPPQPSATATAEAPPEDAGAHFGGTGIGLGSISPPDGGWGAGQGFGSGHGRLGGSHASDAGLGRIPPEEIQRIVRANFGRVKLCYTKALRKDPATRGRFAARFVIDRSGDVASASSDATTTLTDAELVDCIVSVFKSLKFPQPEGGIVTVVYPLDLSPGD